MHIFFQASIANTPALVVSNRSHPTMVPEIERRISKAIPDRYRIVREVGAGGMAYVFLAEDLKLGRRVAIKVLRPELSASVSGTRFHREVRIAAGLAHPNIVPIHDSGEADGLLYFVMRFQEGESLRALLDRDGALPVGRAVAIARDVAAGLAHAHGQGVIHRDIKPANILLTGEHAVIADFGVARGIEAGTSDEAGLTATAAVLGTPLYMSPEQALASAEIDGRSDIYSLGCVLYEMLTGDPPFQAKGVRNILASHLHREVPSLAESRPGVPSPLDDIARRCLAKSPEARFTTTDDLRRSLEAVQAGLDRNMQTFGIRWRWLSRRTRRLVATGAVVSFVALSALLGRVLLWPEGPSLNASSVVVLSFRGPMATTGEEEFLVGFSEELTRQLNQWDSVSAVPQISLSGILFDRGIDRPTLERVDEGLEIARELGAGTLVALRADLRGDSFVVSADLFNSETGRTNGQTIEIGGETEDPFPMAAEVAHNILGLESLHPDLEGLRRQSAIPEALIEYEAGRKALERWRLAEAERCLRRATALDPRFAMAHHLLALTLYWQYEEGL
ncbi:MAG: protein kinase domain-containing protein, partial [Longimicrobiales bacterium]